MDVLDLGPGGSHNRGNFFPIQIESLEELHNLNFVHKNINPNTCYFFNRPEKISSGLDVEVHKSTHYAVNILDIT